MTIAELIQEAVGPDELLSSGEVPGSAGHVGAGDVDSVDDPVRHAKLHDLGVIYAAYLDYLGADRFPHVVNLWSCLLRH